MNSPIAAGALRATCQAWRLPLVALLLLAAGCETARKEWREGPTEADSIASGSAATRREVAMNRQWQQQPFSRLRAALGEPVLLMDIPGGGSPPGMVAVYQVDPATGCRDAFALVFGQDPVVRVYHCR
ncbi:hypothetical protein RAMLITH_13860 [Ramlibacter sp. RBP-2]|uniref:Uncharacterized protein n=1 Tax=Ramlibacter lithotrophicus TaxID=2606681 RepID=A0A7X6I6Y2_9BURK|nr:hypothetical protein [Ramlibacter lithotrophicus]NKE66911.1 hypothetical protein [Ramlibacter lithotrophicus]